MLASSPGNVAAPGQTGVYVAPPGPGQTEAYVPSQGAYVPPAAGPVMRLRGPVLHAVSMFASLAFLGWFITEIIGHSYSDMFNATNNLAGPFNEQSLQLFMYTSMLTLANLAANWYGDFTRTRASRNMALSVTTFTVFAWLWNLWFVIPAFRSSGDGSNYYCNGELTSLSRWCDLYRASAAFSCALELAMVWSWMIAALYYLTLRTPAVPIPTQATILAPHRSLVAASESGAHNADVPWYTELTEPDDLEQLKITANNPQINGPISQRVHIMGHIVSLFTTLSMAGWLILCCALIDVARIVGLQAWQTTEDASYPSLVNSGSSGSSGSSGATFSGSNRLGDPIIAANWYWLTLSLGITLGMSSYSCYRRNRGIIGAAMVLTWLSALQWVSLFVYAARRVAELNSHNPNQPISFLNNAENSQYAEVAGAGLICFSELCRSLLLLIHYMRYMLVTKLDHDRVHVPSHVDAPTVVQAERDAYNPNYAGHYDGSNAVNEQDYKVANQVPEPVPTTEVNIPGPAYDPADGDLYIPSYNMGIFHGSSVGFRVTFFFQALTILAWWVMQVVQEANSGLLDIYGPNPESGNVPGGLGTQEAPDRSYYYNEYMFLLSTALVIGAYLPAFYAEREVSVAAALSSVYASSLMVLGFFLLVWTWSYESIYGWGTLYSDICTSGPASYCRMTQAAGIFALINVFFLVCLWLHSVIRLGERRLTIVVYERNFQNAPALTFAPLIIAAIGIWAFTTLYFGLFSSGLVAQLQSNNGFIGFPIQSYFASQAFLTFTACAAAVIVGTYASQLLYAWQSWAWRMVSLFTALLAAAFLVPLIIYAARFINIGGLSSAQLALASAIIILCFATAFYLACYVFLVHTAFYAAGPAGAAIPPTGMVLKANQQFVGTKNEQGVIMDPATGQPVATYTSNTAYGGVAEPVVNPRTGDTAVGIEQYPVAAPGTTTVTQPAQYTTTAPGMYTGAANPVTTEQLEEGNQVVYHD